MMKSKDELSRKVCFWCPLFCFLILVFSCDLLRSSPYDVVAWTPGEGFHSDPGKIKISVLLSHEPDKVKTEQAFSLTEDRKTVKGVFSWEGSRLVFTPASPTEADRDYVITLGTGAQDSNGLSLERKFEASFTTRHPGGKSKVIKTEPGYEGSLSESRGEFRLFFSAPVHLGACMDSISFSPSMPGSWHLEDGDKTACFTPREPWQAGIQYRVKVESGFAGVSGVVLGTDYSSVFSFGQDKDKPALLKAFAVFPGEGAPGDEYYTFAFREEIPLVKNFPGEPGHYPDAKYTGWENSTRLELVFSGPVDLGGLRNLLVTEPSAPLVMESRPEISNRAVFRFTEFPAWGSSFLFRLNPGVKDMAGNESVEECLFRIANSGPLSKPPALMGIRLPMAPGKRPDTHGGTENQIPLCFTPKDLLADLPVEIREYPFSEKTYTWIELYFETVPETEIDMFSVMDLFRVETTNQALSFSPRSIVDRDFTWMAPESGWENFRRLEIRGYLTNSINSGVVTFRIPPGLRDKRGNRSTTDFRISLLK
jgi:hypothetical protein